MSSSSSSFSSSAASNRAAAQRQQLAMEAALSSIFTLLLPLRGGGERPLDNRRFNDVLAQSFYEAQQQAPPNQRKTSSVVVESLPHHRVSESGHKCSICLEEWEIGASVRTLPCQHMFDDVCIQAWLKDHNQCPCCRYPLLTDDEAYNRKVTEEQRAFEKARDDLRQSQRALIRQGQTPDVFRGMCIRSVLLGTASSCLLHEGNTDAMVQLSHCSHHYHRECLLAEQRILRSMHRAPCVHSVEDDQVEFVCPACLQCSTSYSIVSAETPPASAECA
jgi:E3 ubiquitin-protein ligase RNF115/126